MGHSTQEYRGKQAILNDLDVVALVEVALTAEAQQFRDLAQSWSARIEPAGVGCIDLRLDEVDEETLLRFLGEVRSVAEAMGQRAPIRVSDKYGVGASFDGYSVELILQAIAKLEGVVRSN